MTIQTFIEKAIKGGYDYVKAAKYQKDNVNWPAYEIFLDPLAWQAVGKVKNWGKIMIKGEDIWGWKEEMHRMIDALAEGKTIEAYLKTL